MVFVASGLFWGSSNAAATPTSYTASVASNPAPVSDLPRKVIGPLAVGGALTMLALSTEDIRQIGERLDHIGSASEIDALGSGWVMAAGIAGMGGYGLAAGKPGARDLALDLTKGWLITSIAVTGLKLTVHRARPDGGGHSFPSGHSATAFMAAPILTEHLGWKAAVPTYALASLVGVGRMEDSRHYLSDVVAGAAIGIAAGNLIAHQRSHSRLEVRPTGIGVTYNW